MYNDLLKIVLTKATLNYGIQWEIVTCKQIYVLLSINYRVKKLLGIEKFKLG